MPLDIAKIKNEEKDASLEYAGEEVNFRYLPHAIDGSWEEQMQNGAADNDVAAIRRAVLHVLVSWDLQSDGEDLPLDEDSLKALPLELLTGILNSIQGQRRPNQQAAASNGGQRTSRPKPSRKK